MNTSRIGELAAEYEVTRELGRGGTAVVYHARERELGRDVAIKVVHQTHVDDAEAVERLAREARLVAQLRHPNIVTLYGTRRLTDGSLALIMQYVPGRTLKEAVRDEGPLPIATVETVLREIGLALHYAHQRQGLVHRDIKPENIYLDVEGGRTLLSDFGIARTSEVESSLTLAGTALGTPAYMSPEQIDGLPLDGRSDLYSLGLVAYEMLTGQQPWAGHNLYTIIYRQKHEDLPPLREFRSDIPHHMQRAVDGLLRKDRMQRWNDAAAFVAQLRPGTATGGIPAPALTQRGSARRASVAPPLEDSPTIVYRPQDDARRRVSRPHTAAPPEPVEPVEPVEPREPAELAELVSAPSDDTDPTPSRTGAPASAAADMDAPFDGDSPSDADAPSDASVPSDADAPSDAGLTSSDSPALSRLEPAASIDTSEPVSIAPASPQDHDMPVLRFMFDADDDVHGNVAAPPRTPRTRKRRLPVLIGMGALLTLAGAMAPFIGQGADGGDPNALNLTTTPASADPAGATAPLVSTSAGVPAALVLLTDNQTGHVGETLPLPVGVVVEDAEGRPVAGVEVELEVVTGGGSVDPAVTMSDSRGLAMTRWTLGEVPGANELAARIRGMPETETVFTARGVAGTVSRLAAVEGDDQSALRGTVLPEAIVVRVEDPNGNPIEGVRVDFDVAAGGGSVQPAYAMSGADGVVRTSWTLGTEQDAHTLRASAHTNLSVEFTATARYRLTPRARLVTGGTHTCTLTAAGAVTCWGGNDNGQLGAGSTQRLIGAAQVGGAPAFARLAAGVSHTCALDRDGAAYCWGVNDAGQLGVGDQSRRAAPTRVRTGGPFTAITAGLAHTCALTEDGSAWCWGDGSSGQLGDGGTGSRNVPVRTGGGQSFTALSAGWRHTCGLTSQGVAYCWGSNGIGQLGNGTTTRGTTPVRVAGDLRFVAISAGASHTCGVISDGQAYCWGQNASGQLGSGNGVASPRPVRVPTSASFAGIAAGAVHTCALTAEGVAHCWGRNNFGQLGNAGTADSPEPIVVAGDLRFTSLSSSGSHTCARAVSGEDYCWGYNVDGQLGDGTRTDRSEPVRVRTTVR